MLIITSTKEVMFLVWFVCLFVSRITEELLDWFLWNLAGWCSMNQGRNYSFLEQIQNMGIHNVFFTFEKRRAYSLDLFKDPVVSCTQTSILTSYKKICSNITMSRYFCIHLWERTVIISHKRSFIWTTYLRSFNAFDWTADVHFDTLHTITSLS